MDYLSSPNYLYNIVQLIILKDILKVDRDSQTPLYLQIAGGIVVYIRQGLLRPGDALPPTRVLAAALKVHRKTVIAAYDELYAQNWIDLITRRGMFVAKNLPDIAARTFTDNHHEHRIAEKTGFSMTREIQVQTMFSAARGTLVFNDGFPDTRIAPVGLLVREYRRLAAYRFTDRYLMYGPEQGSENLRNELAKFLSSTRGLKVSAADILITKGFQMATYLVSQLLLTKNDVVIVGDPGYPGANEVFLNAGAKLWPVAVDQNGLDVDAVADVCKTRKVRLIYTIPHHHTPTTVTLSPQRRMQLLELAKKYRFAILEDDYDYDFQYSSSPVLPLASADYTGNVIYVGSFCKTIAPGIRIGFMIAPHNLIIQAARLRRLIDRQGEQLLEEAMACLLSSGDIGRHLKKANKLYHERRDMLVVLLNEHLSDHITFKVPNGGFAIWITYNPGIDPAEVSKIAEGAGLKISDGSGYYIDSKYPNRSIRLGFASLNEREMKEAVILLKNAVLKVLNT